MTALLVDSAFFFIKIWIGDIYDICFLIFVFLILEDLWM